MIPSIEDHGYCISINHGVDKIRLVESDQRIILKWFAKNKPEMVREIVCEECPEHVVINTNEPRCIENHHGDDGRLIQYLGEGKPCSSCKSRQVCFEAFYKYLRSDKK